MRERSARGAGAEGHEGGVAGGGVDCIASRASARTGRSAPDGAFRLRYNVARAYRGQAHAAPAFRLGGRGAVRTGDGVREERAHDEIELDSAANRRIHSLTLVATSVSEWN